MVEEISKGTTDEKFTVIVKEWIGKGTADDGVGGGITRI